MANESYLTFKDDEMIMYTFISITENKSGGW